MSRVSYEYGASTCSGRNITASGDAVSCSSADILGYGSSEGPRTSHTACGCCLCAVTLASRTALVLPMCWQTGVLANNEPVAGKFLTISHTLCFDRRQRHLGADFEFLHAARRLASPMSATRTSVSVAGTTNAPEMKPASTRLSARRTGRNSARDSEVLCPRHHLLFPGRRTLAAAEMFNVQVNEIIIVLVVRDSQPLRVGCEVSISGLTGLSP